MAKKARKDKGLSAGDVHRHLLYQAAVQDPVIETDNVIRMFRRARKRNPLTLREDFCGTALACAEWVRSDAARTAYGLDLDRAVLAWGQEHNIDPLGEEARRVQLRRQNVISETAPQVDLCTAFNFSYCIFKTRRQLLDYFRCVRASLVEDGLFMVDLYGGWDAQAVLEEFRSCKLGKQRFKYRWDQSYFNPVNNHAINHIHFSFADGTETKKAFTYDWRLWSSVELIEVMEEAGFARARFWYETEDADGEGTGIHVPMKRIDNQPGWIGYVIGEV